MDWLLDVNLWGSFLSLTALEIILGVDNIVFIALLVGNLPESQQKLARQLGLGLALGMRIGLLFAISWIMTLTEPLFDIAGHDLSGKDILMLAGGGFLIYKGTSSIHDEITGDLKADHVTKAKSGFIAVVAQIALIDLVFSFDSVITAIGLTQQIYVIIAAMTIAMLVMLVISGYIADFLKKFPTLKMLALSFIMLIGVLLVADGLGVHVPKGYIYSAMAFSVLVEGLNLWRQSRRKRRE
jgi:predicted tellurium resistance membrane protein TerC